MVIKHIKPKDWILDFPYFYANTANTGEYIFKHSLSRAVVECYSHIHIYAERASYTVLKTIEMIVRELKYVRKKFKPILIEIDIGSCKIPLMEITRQGYLVPADILNALNDPLLSRMVSQTNFVKIIK